MLSTNTKVYCRDGGAFGGLRVTFLLAVKITSATVTARCPGCTPVAKRLRGTSNVLIEGGEMVHTWQIENMLLRLRVPGLSWVAVKYNAAVFKSHFLVLGTDPDQTKIPFDAMRDKVELFVIRSHPVGAPPPKLAQHSREWLRYAPTYYRHHFIELKGSFDEYLAKFSSKTRGNLKKKVKRFAELSGGQLDFTEYKRPEQIETFYREACAISALTFQQRLLACGIPQGDAFLARLKAWAAEDRLRAYVLRTGGAPVAYLCCPIEDGVVLYEWCGYDPAFRNYSPGTVLFYKMLERLFAERRFSLFDFTEGDGAHKELFATGNTMCSDLWYFRRTPRNAAVVTGFAAAHEATRWANAALDRYNLKGRVRAFIRWGRSGTAAEALPLAAEG